MIASFVTWRRSFIISEPLPDWQSKAEALKPENSAIFFREVHGIDNPWNPFLTQERTRLISTMSSDPRPQATSVPVAPHPAKSVILRSSVSGRVMVGLGQNVGRVGVCRLVD